MLKTVLVAITAAFLLSGCEAVFTNSIQDYHDTRSMGREYISENKANRKEIRDRCHKLVMKQVDALEAEGKFAEALDVLSKAYPPLVTMSIIDEGPDALNKAVVCG